MILFISKECKTILTALTIQTRLVTFLASTTSLFVMLIFASELKTICIHMWGLYHKKKTTLNVQHIQLTDGSEVTTDV